MRGTASSTRGTPSSTRGTASSTRGASCRVSRRTCGSDGVPRMLNRMSRGETSWSSLAAEWAAALPRPTRKLRKRELEARGEAFRTLLDRAVAHARRRPKAFWDWFLTLKSENRANGSLVGNVLKAWKGTVPKRAFLPLLRAAVEESCPSFNRTYVEPAVRTYGPDAATEALLEWLERGTAAEKAGAASALYWVRVERPKDPEDLEAEAARLEEHAAKMSGKGAKQLRERAAARRQTAEQMRRDGAPAKNAYTPRSKAVVAREQVVRLRQFLGTEDIQARRAILAGLGLDAAKYPAKLRPLVKRAIEIARSSDDEYLRKRVEIQLGNWE
jgi:hypothetical protein